MHDMILWFGVIFTSGEWNINMSDAVNKDNLLPKIIQHSQQNDDSMTTKFWTHRRMREDRKIPQQCRWRSCLGSCLHKNLKLLTPFLCIKFKVCGYWIWIYFTTVSEEQSVLFLRSSSTRELNSGLWWGTQNFEGVCWAMKCIMTVFVWLILRQNHMTDSWVGGGSCSLVTAAFGTSNDFMESSDTSWLIR